MLERIFFLNIFLKFRRIILYRRFSDRVFIKKFFRVLLDLGRGVSLRCGGDYVRYGICRKNKFFFFFLRRIYYGKVRA